MLLANMTPAIRCLYLKLIRSFAPYNTFLSPDNGACNFLRYLSVRIKSLQTGLIGGVNVTDPTPIKSSHIRNFPLSPTISPHTDGLI